MSQTSVISGLTHRLTGAISKTFHKKPRTLEAILYKSDIEQGYLILYFIAIKRGIINRKVYHPVYMPMEEPLVREIYQSLAEKKQVTFSGTYNPPLDSRKDELKRNSNGTLIQLEGELQVGHTAYLVKFDVDRSRPFFGRMYATTLTHIEYKE